MLQDANYLAVDNLLMFVRNVVYVNCIVTFFDWSTHLLLRFVCSRRGFTSSSEISLRILQALPLSNGKVLITSLNTE